MNRVEEKVTVVMKGSLVRDNKAEVRWRCRLAAPSSNRGAVPVAVDGEVNSVLDHCRALSNVCRRVCLGVAVRLGVKAVTRRSLTPRIVFALLLSGSFSASAYAQSELDLELLMSPAEFKAAGLDKLNASELQRLEAWLAQKGIRSPAMSSQAAEPESNSSAQTSTSPSATLPATAVESAPKQVSEAQFGKEQIRIKPEPDSVPDSITAQIIGEFRGWDGNTIFRLDNGQVWQQRVGGSYRGPRRIDPQVVIEKGRFGYYLSLEGSRRSVGVKRIK